MTALQVFLWLGVAALALLVALAVTKRKGRSDWGFKDVVKDPSYFQGFSQAINEADGAAEAAQSWSDEKVASFARKYVLEAVTSRDAWAEARILRKLGERSHPAILSLLQDPNLYPRLVTPTGTILLPEAPFKRACSLLGEAPPPEAVPALAPFLKDESAQIRKDAALAMARTGAPSISSPVRSALADEDEYVRSSALMGLQFALERSALAENLREELFPDVQALLESSKNADKAADVLFGLHAERATEFFLSEKVFTVDSRILHEALETLANNGVRVPREWLLQLVSSLEARELEHPRVYVLGGALRLLGQHQQEEDRAFLHARIKHKEEGVAEGAAAGLLCSHGLEGFEKGMWEIEEKAGYAGFNQHQRFYSAVRLCDGEINNGGFAQYFLNSSGDTWRDAIAGLEAMGSKERLILLKEAVAFFGSGGPSTEHHARQQELSKLFKKDDAIFEELENRYYKSTESVEVLARSFVIANAESFR